MSNVSAGSGSHPGRTGIVHRLEGGKADIRPLARALYHLDIEHRGIRAGFAHSLGLSSSEFNALMIISDFGELTPKRLAQHLAMTTGSATAMIDRLESAGFLARTPNPNDRRSLLLNLTAKGHKAKEKVIGTYLATITTIAEADDLATTPAMIESLERIADALRDSVEKMCSSSE